MLLYFVVYCALQNDRHDGYVFALEMFGVDGHMDRYWYNYILLYSVVYCALYYMCMRIKKQKQSRCLCFHLYHVQVCYYSSAREPVKAFSKLVPPHTYNSWYKNVLILEKTKDSVWKINWRTESATFVRHTIYFLNRFEIKTPYSSQTTMMSDTAMKQNVDRYHRIDLPMLAVIWNGEMQDIQQKQYSCHFDMAKTATFALQ